MRRRVCGGDRKEGDGGGAQLCGNLRQRARAAGDGIGEALEKAKTKRIALNGLVNEVEAADAEYGGAMSKANSAESCANAADSVFHVKDRAVERACDVVTTVSHNALVYAFRSVDACAFAMEDEDADVLPITLARNIYDSVAKTCEDFGSRAAEDFHSD